MITNALAVVGGLAVLGGIARFVKRRKRKAQVAPLFPKGMTWGFTPTEVSPYFKEIERQAATMFHRNMN